MSHQLSATNSVGPTAKHDSKSPIYQQCYLCGVSGVKLEKEHVIPKILFRPYTLSDPIVLRACSNCNRTKGLDDEYVGRLLHTTSFSTSGNAITKEWLRKTRAKEVAAKGAPVPGLGIVNGFRDNLVPPADYNTASNEITKHLPSMKIDGSRLESFFGNIAKGLTTLETGIIFDWSEYEIILEYEQPVASGQRMYRDKNHPFWMSYRHSTFSREWDDYFSFSGASVRDPDGQQERYASAWSFIAYLSHTVVTLIVPRKQ